jgi:tRNA (guanine-N7-)-methyltransferase
MTPSATPALPDLMPAGWTAPGAPVLEFDVGCHKGRFLVDMAEAYPDRNFLGIEQQADRVERAQKKIDRRALNNARVILGEGWETLRTFPPACAGYIHVLFPDPWPKRKHHSRRLVQTDFLKTCAHLLKPGGILRLVTDDADYARFMRNHASNVTHLFVPTEEERTYPITEFQYKFITDGRPFYELLLRLA